MKKIVLGLVALFVLGVSASALAIVAPPPPPVPHKCTKDLEVQISVNHVCSLKFVVGMPALNMPAPVEQTMLDLGSVNPGGTASGNFYVFSAANFKHKLSFSWFSGAGFSALWNPLGYGALPIEADWSAGRYDAFTLAVTAPLSAVAGGPVAAGILTATMEEAF